MPITKRLGADSKGGEMETAGMMRWLLTYADMITLLLALFIILFAISTINKVKLQRLVRDLGGGFNNIDAINNPPNGQGTTGSQLQQMQSQLQQYISQHQLQTQVQTQVVQNGQRKELVITLLSDKAFYDSGSAALRPGTNSVLDAVAKELKTRRNDVRVEGFTDNVPIHTAQYPSNWELSAARAVGVARYLVEEDGISPRRVTAAGYGEFRPKVANDTDVHRQENRRVDIVVLDTQQGGSATAPAEEQP